MYEQKIRMLEESHRLIENQLFQLEKTTNPDLEKIKSLKEQKDKYLIELRTLRRLQYDYDHNTVDFDDDR
jgi:hypothetical protein